MPRLKEDYNSRKWSTTNVLLAAPSFSRSYLSKSLGSSFGSEILREKWLEISLGSTVSPSKVPPEGITRYNPPSPEKKREVFVQNKASYLRIKSCPPNYILNPRSYRDIIQRNRDFAFESKSIQLSSINHRMPNGETLRSFLLGARYSECPRPDSGLSGKCDLSAPGGRGDYSAQSRGTTPGNTPRNTPGTPGRIYTSAHSQTHTSGGHTEQKQSVPSRPTQLSSSRASNKKISYSEKSKLPSGHSPSPIAIITSNSHASRSQKPLIHSTGSAASSHVELPLQATSSQGPGSPSSSKQAQEPSPKEAAENSSQFDKKPQENEHNDLAKEEENYFISPEAQKLAGKILEDEEAHTGKNNGDSVSDEEKPEQNHEYVQDIESGSDLKAPSNTPTLVESKSEAAAEIVSAKGSSRGEARVSSGGVRGKSPGSVTDVVAEEANMASKSSTIFVDMSNLSIQHEDA